MDSNSILTGLKNSFDTYGSSQKVLKFSGDSFDIRERGDVKREVVVFRFLGGDFGVELGAEKPSELSQDVQALVYVKQDDKSSTKDIRNERLLDLKDEVISWLLQADGSSISNDVCVVKPTSVSKVDENDGYLSTTINFTLTINLI